MRFYLSFVSLKSLTNEVQPGKSFPTPKSCRVLKVFSSSCFSVLGLTPSSLIYLELMSVQVGRHGSNFIFLHVDIWFSQHHLLKMCMLWASSSSIRAWQLCALMFGSAIGSNGLHDSFVPVSCFLLLQRSNIYHKFQVVILPALFFFWLRVTLATQGLLWFHVSFRIILSVSVKYVVGVLAGIALNLQVASFRLLFYINFKEHGRSFYFLMSSSISSEIQF